MIRNKWLSSKIYVSACADILVSDDGIPEVINKGTYFINSKDFRFGMQRGIQRYRQT